MQMGHRKLTKKEMEDINHEYCAVLTMCDVATRNVVYVPVVSESAMETAMAVITDWMPVFSIPDIIISIYGDINVHI